MHRSPIRSVAVVSCLVCSCLLATACLSAQVEERRDGWRGPFNNGFYPAHDLPRQFDLQTNLRWCTPMPSVTIAEPIVVGRQVITLADPDEVIACDIDTGAIRWRTRVDAIGLIGAQRGIDSGDIDRDRRIYQRAYALEYVKAYGDGYAWRGGRRQLAQAIALLGRLYEVIPGMAVREVPTLTSLEEQFGKAGDRKSARKIGEHLLGLGKVAWRHLESRYGKRFGTTWMTLVTRVPSTPVTDGEYIFVHMAQGQVACLDADGEIRWFHDAVAGDGAPFKGGGARFVPSPLLAEGKMIIAGGYHVMALDAETGRVVWDHEVDEIGNSYNCGSPVYLRAGAAAEEPLYGAVQPSGVGIIVTATGQVYRLDDGKLLLERLPEGIAMCSGERGGGTPVPVGADGVCFQGGDNRGGPNLGIRFSVAGTSAVRAEVLWSSTSGSTNSASGAWWPAKQAVLLPDHANRNNGILAIGAPDGQRVAYLEETGFSWPSPAVADGCLFLVRPAKMKKNKRKRTVQITVFDLQRQQRVHSIDLYDELPPERIGFLAEVAADVFPKANVEPGKQQSGLHPYGNVLLLRTKGGLICWGKPGAYEPPAGR